MFGENLAEQTIFFTKENLYNLLNLPEQKQNEMIKIFV